MSDRFAVSLTFGGNAGIEDVAQQVSDALGVTFEVRESLFLGGEYYRSRSDRGGVVVQHNDDLGEPAEPSHPELPTLVRIQTTAMLEPALNEALGPLDLILIDPETRPSR